MNINISQCHFSDFPDSLDIGQEVQLMMKEQNNLAFKCFTNLT